MFLFFKFIKANFFLQNYFVYNVTFETSVIIYILYIYTHKTLSYVLTIDIKLIINFLFVLFKCLL